jgi:hypothetical protein
MQGIVGKNHVVTGYRDNTNGTIDLRVEWVALPKRPPQGKRERIRRLRQDWQQMRLTNDELEAAIKRVERE